ERTELDERGDAAEVDDLVLGLERIAEAAELGDPLVERRLAALEPGWDRGARAGLLALRASAGRLATACGDAPTDAGPSPVATGRGAQIRPLHAFSSAGSGRASGTSSTATMNRTWRTMPRMAGLSGTTTVSPM